MNHTSAKKLLKLAIFLYLTVFLTINWNDVSWIFNYRVMYGLVTDFFTPYPSITSNSFAPYFYPNKTQTNGSAIPHIKTNAVTQNNILQIPSLSLSVPIIFSTSTEIASLENDLDKGVVYYPGSVYPGQVGNMVVLGHSAPLGWPKIKHDWVFSEIEKLKIGDLVTVNFNNNQYTYIVRETTIIKAGQEIPSGTLAEKTNVLNLVSCWPPGNSIQRIVVQAELKMN